MDHGIEVPAPADAPAPIDPATPADAEPPMPIPAPAAPAAPVATTVAAEPAAPVASESSSLEYLIGAAVIVCLAAVWKAYRKLAQKQKR